MEREEEEEEGAPGDPREVLNELHQAYPDATGSRLGRPYFGGKDKASTTVK